ncbi:hypothetical protein Rumeso_02826 [Rubellimicrobium mesophilum DSM 19309]|uniref:Uncharacterized protein n=1 Tax=Rubellimicrobium mesophilum DSM 19309 TaxID=442562 RepID=A0A017HMS9_9RHOB|nr:hypothetical protein [Rubellimicrobium mesophilum]EYD75610.1 hypothetical protein Rumeso_02826 [Rubellimicrobium mesophilum DSM 19309]
MTYPTLRQSFDKHMSTPEQPPALGWADFFQWLGQQTVVPKPRGPLPKLIQE